MTDDVERLRASADYLMRTGHGQEQEDGHALTRVLDRLEAAEAALECGDELAEAAYPISRPRVIQARDAYLEARAATRKGQTDG